MGEDEGTAGEKSARAFSGFCVKPCLRWAETLQQDPQSLIKRYLSPLTDFGVCFLLFIISFSCWLGTPPPATSHGESPHSRPYRQPAGVMAGDGCVQLEKRVSVSFLPSYGSTFCRKQSGFILAVWLSSLKQAIAKMKRFIT